MRALFVAVLVVGVCALGVGCGKKKSDDSGGGSDTPGDKKGGPGGPDGPGPGKPGGARTGPSFTVGKDTTHITGPLLKDGRVDYVTALNERLSKGVTPEKNANVGLWKVFGPNPTGEMPPGYFDMLGMKEPPAGGEYFVGLNDYSIKNGSTPRAARDALKTRGEKPWKTTDDPVINGWLQANHKQLLAVREAVKLPHYYNPVIPKKGVKGYRGLVSSPMPGVQVCREVAAGLLARAMLYLGHGQTLEAWLDLLTCHRLARHLARGGILLEVVDGAMLEEQACKADLVLLNYTQPDKVSLQACLKDLATLPPLKFDIAAVVDLAERYQFLDTVMVTDRDGIAHLMDLDATDRPRMSPPETGVVSQATLNGIDWDPALKSANEWFDQFAAALRIKDRAERTRKFKDLTSRIVTLKSVASDKDRIEKLAGEGMERSKAQGQALGDVLISLLMPAIDKVQTAADRAAQWYEQVILSFALEWYQRFNGKYPDKIADLVPTYLSAEPLDLFSGKPLPYAGGVNGCFFHSVGPNGFDDSGGGDDLNVNLTTYKKK